MRKAMVTRSLSSAFLSLTVLLRPGWAVCDVGQCQGKFAYNASQSATCRTAEAAMGCGRQLLTAAGCSERVKAYVRHRISLAEQFVSTYCQPGLVSCDVNACLGRVVVNVNRSVHCRTVARAVWCVQVSVLYSSACSSTHRQLAQETIDRASLFLVSHCPSGTRTACDPAICLDKTAAAGQGRDICSVGSAFLSCVETDLVQDASCSDLQQDIRAAQLEVRQYLHQHGCPDLTSPAVDCDASNIEQCKDALTSVRTLEEFCKSSDDVIRCIVQQTRYCRDLIKDISQRATDEIYGIRKDKGCSGVTAVMSSLALCLQLSFVAYFLSRFTN